VGYTIDEQRLHKFLEQVRSGSIDIGEAVSELRNLPYENLDFARIDHHRSIRQGFPEVIYGKGKTPEQIAIISEKVISRSGKLIVTRASQSDYESVLSVVPHARYEQSAGIITAENDTGTKKLPGIAVACAGTSDLPVSMEAYLTAEMMGCEVTKIFDIGVAGIHRLFDKLDELQQAKVIVAVAGMEGALPSVIGGLVDVPIIAVPTSVGYGASFGGLSALLAMLNSCAPGIGVVNIDNGFGAGYLAASILLSGSRSKKD